MANFKLEEMFPGRPGIENVNSILGKCIVLDEAACFKDASLLLAEVNSAIDWLEQTETVQEIVLAASGPADFRVRIKATRFQLNATPLQRNQKGEWIPDESAQAPIVRWQLLPDGKGFSRIPQF